MPSRTVRSRSTATAPTSATGSLSRTTAGPSTSSSDVVETGRTYNVGGHNEKTNLEVVHAICDLVDELVPRPDGSSRRDLVTFRDRSAGARSALRHRRVEDRRTSSAGHPTTTSTAVCEPPSSGTSPIRPGATRSPPIATMAPAWGSQPESQRRARFSTRAHR